MAYPCIVHGEEIGKSDHGVCEHCESEVMNAKWCKKHQIFHWKDVECPLCWINTPGCSIKEITTILEGEEV